ncbi:MAG: YkgJ family cysteine cluster protein, partial [Nannocystaceae bacterium]
DERASARAAATRADYPWWPCAEGCATCCRTLSTLPRLTHNEWERLARAVRSLPAPVREGIDAAVRGADAGLPSEGEIVCPLLDRDTERCRVYEARPLTCRTYGFFAGRSGTRACDLVLERVTEHDAQTAVTWGNEDGMQRELSARCGEARSLTRWWDDSDVGL